MPNASPVNKAPHITKGDVFDDLGLSPTVALEAKIKAEIWHMLVGHIESLEMKQRELAHRLQIHQPDVSNLLGGKISKFSVDALIHYAVTLDIGVEVKLTAPPQPRIRASILQVRAGASKRHKAKELAAA